MKGPSFFFVFPMVLQLSACVVIPRVIPDGAVPPAPVEPPPAFQIIDYRAKDLEEMPLWVRLYISEGTRAVERLPQYNNKYVFIGESTGQNSHALRQWAEEFNSQQDRPLLVSARIQERLVRSANGRPDAEFGFFFERAIKAVIDGNYSGAQREGDFWILFQYLGETEFLLPGETYRYFVLLSIDTEVLKQEINEILSNVVGDPRYTREQNAAIARILGVFFDDF
jgi:hypothetical protein